MPTLYIRWESACTHPDQLVCIAGMLFTMYTYAWGTVWSRRCTNYEAAVSISLASSLERICSNKESSACEISGFIEATLRDPSFVPYLYLTSLNSPEWINLNHVRTIMFPNVGENSSSLTTMTSMWRDVPLFRSSLSSTNAKSRWYKSSGCSCGSKRISAKSINCTPVA